MFSFPELDIRGSLSTNFITYLHEINIKTYFNDESKGRLRAKSELTRVMLDRLGGEEGRERVNTVLMRTTATPTGHR